jgi:integrase/recombinase XerC
VGEVTVESIVSGKDAGSWPILRAKVAGSFRSPCRGGEVWGLGLSPGAVLQIVRGAATAIGVDVLAPHDLRRTCAKLCRKRGGELEQIQFLLGHASIATTEKYLGSEQDLAQAVNDDIL